MKEFFNTLFSEENIKCYIIGFIMFCIGYCYSRFCKKAHSNKESIPYIIFIKITTSEKEWEKVNKILANCSGIISCEFIFPTEFIVVYKDDQRIDELINQLTCGIIRYDISSCEAKIIYKKRQKAEQAEQKEKIKLVLLDKNDFTVLVSVNNYGLTRKYKIAPNSKSVN